MNKELLSLRAAVREKQRKISFLNAVSSTKHTSTIRSDKYNT